MDANEPTSTADLLATLRAMPKTPPHQSYPINRITDEMVVEIVARLEEGEHLQWIVNTCDYMKAGADGRIVIAGAVASAEQIDERIALSVKACSNLSTDQLRTAADARTEGLFKFKQKCEEEAKTLRADRDSLRERLAAAEKENRRLDISETELIRQRDFASGWADKLAYAIGDIEEIGEHSNLNSPWEQAYEIVSRAENVRNLEARIAAAEGKLAKVPALMEAADQALAYFDGRVTHFNGRILSGRFVVDVLRAALTPFGDHR